MSAAGASLVQCCSVWAPGCVENCNCCFAPTALQRLRAALAFDAVHLDLPGIKESDVNPSELVDKVGEKGCAEGTGQQ